MNIEHLPAQPWQFLYGHTPESVPEHAVPPENDHMGIGWKFKEINIGDSSGRLIAKISARTLKDAITYEEFPNTANLILAAPDLLSACVEVLACLANANERQHERDMLQDAINKAINTP